MSDLLVKIFDLTPGSDFSYSTTIIIIALIFIALGIAIQILISVRKERILTKSLRGYPANLYFINVLLLLYTFLRTSNVGLFSMRAVLYFLLIWEIFTLYKLYKAYFIEYPSHYNENVIRTLNKSKNKTASKPKHKHKHKRKHR